MNNGNWLWFSSISGCTKGVLLQFIGALWVFGEIKCVLVVNNWFCYLGTECFDVLYRFVCVGTVELKKQSSCSLQLTNKTDKYVAFKVITCFFITALLNWFGHMSYGLIMLTVCYCDKRLKQPIRKSIVFDPMRVLFCLDQHVMLQVNIPFLLAVKGSGC